MAKRTRTMDFDGMIAKGEADTEYGFKGQTVNGSTRAVGTGWNDQWNWQREQVAPDPTRPTGRSNRTGE